MVTPRLNLTRISEPGQVFQGSVSQAGAVHRATAELGQQIIQTGAKIGSVVERRRADEARDTISKVKAEDRLFSESERTVMQEQFADNPKGFADALEKAQEKRRAKVLKGIDNPDARAIAEQEFEFSKLDNRLKATEFERKRFNVNSKRNIAEGSKAKSMADFNSPTSNQEFLIGLDEDLLDINTRDFNDSEKSSLTEAVTNQRVSGMVSGLMKGGSVRDYQRAEELVDDLGSRISADQNVSLKRKINNDRLYTQNLALSKERQEKAAMKKQFEQEQGGLRDIFTAVTEDPDTDVVDQLKFASLSGKINIKNPTVISEAKMTPDQITGSTNQKYLFLSQLSKTDNPAMLREDLHRNIFTGKMSAEDGEEVLDAMQSRMDSGFKKEQFKFARNNLKSSFSVNQFGTFRKAEDSKTLAKMELQVGEVIREFGVDPVRASNIVLKSNGRDELSLMSRVKGIKSDQSSYEGLALAKQEIVDKLSRKEIDQRAAVRSLKLLDRRGKALDISDIPTIDELRELKRGKK